MAALIFLEDGVSSLLQEQTSKLMQENGPGAYLESVSDSAVGADTVVDSVPGLRTASGSFNTGTTQVNKTITGLGFKPRAIIFWGTANTASNSADLTDANIAFGFTDGTNQQVIAMASLGGGTTGKGWDRQSAVSYMQIDTVSAAIKCQLSIVSLDADGFTLSQGVVPTASFYVNFLAVGGDDVTGAKVGTFSYTAATGNKAITGVGFQPDALFVIGNTVSNTTDNNTMFMVGAAVSATDQAVSMYHSGDSNNPTIVEHHTRYGHLIAMSSVFAGAGFNEAAKLSSFDSDGFTLNVTTNTNHPPMFYLALKGGKYGMGSLTPANSVTTIAKTGLGFKPRGLLLGATNSPQTTTDTGMDSGGGLTIGAASSSSTEQSVWVGDVNGVTPAVSNSFAQQGYLYRGYTPNAATPTATGAISLNSFDADGFTLSQDIAESSASNFAWWLAMGDAATASPTGTAALNTSVGIAASGAPVVSGSASSSTTVSVAAAGNVITTDTGTVAFTAAASVAASGSPVVTGTEASSTSVSVAAAGSPRVSGTGAFTAASSALAAGSPVVSGTEASTTTISTAAAGSPRVTGTAAFTPAVSVVASDGASVTGSASFTPRASVAASGSPVVSAQGATQSSATTTASGSPVVSGAEASSTTVAAVAAGAPKISGTAAVTSPASVAAVGSPRVSGPAAFTTSASISSATAVQGSGATNTTVSLSAAGSPLVRGTVSASTSFGALAAGSPLVSGAASIFASASVTAAGTVSVSGSATLALAASVGGLGSPVVSGSAAVLGAVSVQAAYVRLVVPTAGGFELTGASTTFAVVLAPVFGAELEGSITRADVAAGSTTAHVDSSTTSASIH